MDPFSDKDPSSGRGWAVIPFKKGEVNNTRRMVPPQGRGLGSFLSLSLSLFIKRGVWGGGVNQVFIIPGKL